MGNSKARRQFQLRTLLIWFAILGLALATTIHVHRISLAFDTFYFPEDRPGRGPNRVPAQGAPAP